MSAMGERKHLRPRPALRVQLAGAGIAVMRVQLAPGHVQPEHDHDVVEFAWLRRGHLEHRVGAATLPGRAGSLLILPRARSHAYTVGRDGGELWNLLIDPARIASVALPRPLDRHLPVVLPIVAGGAALLDGVAIGPRLAHLDRELSERDGGWAMAAAMELQLILLAAARAAQAGRIRSLPGGDARVDELRRRIEAEPERRWTLSALAALAGLQPGGLVRAFRRHTGLTPMSWVRGARLRAARVLVAEGAAVAAAARASGFGSASALAKACRRLGGPSPTAWRRA